MTNTTKPDIERVARAMMRTTDINEHNDVETVSMDWCGSELWSCDFEEMAKAAISTMNDTPQWQDISTHNGDEKRVLLFVPPYGAMSGHYDNGWHCHACLNKDAMPTHWQPLPTPPVGE